MVSLFAMLSHSAFGVVCMPLSSSRAGHAGKKRKATKAQVVRACYRILGAKARHREDRDGTREKCSKAGCTEQKASAAALVTVHSG